MCSYLQTADLLDRAQDEKDAAVQRLGASAPCESFAQYSHVPDTDISASSQSSLPTDAAAPERSSPPQAAPPIRASSEPLSDSSSLRRKREMIDDEEVEEYAKRKCSKKWVARAAKTGPSAEKVLEWQQEAAKSLSAAPVARRRRRDEFEVEDQDDNEATSTARIVREVKRARMPVPTDQADAYEEVEPSPTPATVPAPAPASAPAPAPADTANVTPLAEAAVTAAAVATGASAETTGGTRAERYARYVERNAERVESEEALQQ